MRRLDRCYSIADLRREARRRLPGPVFEFLEGGADDEWSVRENRAAFGRLALVPRALEDVRTIDTTTAVLGRQIAFPVLLAPTGMSRLYHGAGELAVARVAARTGTAYALSTYSSCTLEAVAVAADGPRMFQLFTNPGWERAGPLIDRALAGWPGARWSAPARQLRRRTRAGARPAMGRGASPRLGRARARP